MKRSPSWLSPLLIAGAAIGVLALDQWTKDLVVKNFRGCESALYNAPCDSRVVIPHLLNWTYERNFHGAFGMFGSNAVLLIGMAMVVLVVFWFSFREAAARSRLVRVAFGMIVGGAIGNIVDRLHFGYVVDFIDFYRIWGNIFNVADSCITIGVALLLISSLVSRRHQH